MDFFKLDSNGERISLNGLTRNDTDKNIRKVFGSLDDFLLTSLSSQLDSLSFIREGSTKRKEILAKFLDLEIFEKKFKLAKEDASDMKGALKRLQDREYDVEIDHAERVHFEYEAALEEQKDACNQLKEEIEKLVLDIAEIDTKIESIPAEVIDIAQVRLDIKDKTAALSETQEQLVKDKDNLQEKKDLVAKIDKFLEEYDITDLSDKWDKATDLYEELQVFEREMLIIKKRIDTLNEPGFIKGCKCLHEAEKALAHWPKLEKSLEEKTQEHTAVDPDIVAESIRKYNALIEKKDETTRTITSTELEIARNKNTISKIGMN